MIKTRLWRYQTAEQTAYFKGVFILWIIPVYIVCEKVEYHL